MRAREDEDEDFWPFGEAGAEDGPDEDDGVASWRAPTSLRLAGRRLVGKGSDEGEAGEAVSSVAGSSAGSSVGSSVGTVGGAGRASGGGARVAAVADLDERRVTGDRRNPRRQLELRVDKHGERRTGERRAGGPVEPAAAGPAGKGRFELPAMPGVPAMPGGVSVQDVGLVLLALVVLLLVVLALQG